MADIKSLLEAIGVLKAADPNLVNALSADADLAKATSVGPAAAKMPANEQVETLWQEGHTNASATKEQIKTGPDQSASGSGAEKMVRDYSNPVDQRHGIASTPEKLADMMGHLNASMKAMAEGMKSLGEGQLAVKSLLLAVVKGDTAINAAPAVTDKAKKSESEDDEEDEESEVVEINEGKAKSLLLKAKRLLKAAKKADKDAEDMQGDEKTACSGKAKSLRSDAEIVLGKARTHAYAAGSDDLKKSIRDLASKAGVSVVEEEEEEDDEEADKAKTTKAVTDDKGNQADRMDPKNGNQAAAATKSEVTPADLKKALDGIAILQTTVAGMMNVISGKSRVSDLVPDISKARIEAIDSIPLAINDMEDSGVLNQTDAFAARDIHGKLVLAKAGKIDMTQVQDRIAKTSPTVRALFTDKLSVAA